MVRGEFTPGVSFFCLMLQLLYNLVEQIVK